MGNNVIEKRGKEERDLYKTTFHETITYEVRDFISYSFIENVVKEIAQRAGVDEEQVQLSVSAKNYSIDMYNTEVHSSLIDAKKYNREIDGLLIDSGIVYRSKKEDTAERDHHKIEFNFTRSTNYTNSSLRVYGVSHRRATSQEVLDWGNGAIRDFQALQILDQKPKTGEPVVNLKTGYVEAWESDTAIQKVEVVNQVSTKGTTWRNFLKDPNPTVAFIGIIVATGLAVVGWVWFSK